MSTVSRERPRGATSRMDGKKHTSKKKPLDDDDDDGFGLRTPTKGEAPKPVKKDPPPKLKSDSHKAVKDEKPAPRKSDVGKVEKAEKAEKAEKRPPTGKLPRKTDSGSSPRPKGDPAGGPRRSKAPLVVGTFVVLAAGAGGIWALLPPEHQDKPTQIKTTAVQPAQPGTPRNVQAQSIPSSAPVVDAGALTPVGGEPLTPNAQPLPLTAPGTALDKTTIDELAARSAQHAELARILGEFADLFKFDPNAMNPIEEDFQNRQRREDELVARIRALGPAAAGALMDMVLALDNRAHQIFLSRGLAGIPGPEAADAVEKILAQNKDVAIQTTLVRFLPEGAEASGLIGRAFANEQNPHLRTMLLRELSARDQPPEGQAVTGPSPELFRQAALQDGDPNVRAEAVSIIGRRGSPDDAAIMEQLAKTEQNVQIRQRAIVAFAETSGQGSLRYLEDLARDPSAGIPVRASAVLAIGRVGDKPEARDPVVRALDTIAATDPDQDIRVRAQRTAASLRARSQQDANGPGRVDDEPLRLGPGGVPLGPGRQ